MNNSRKKGQRKCHNQLGITIRKCRNAARLINHNCKNLHQYRKLLKLVEEPEEIIRMIKM